MRCRLALLPILALLAALALVSAVGCADTEATVDEFGIGEIPPELVCKSDADCESGEACTKGACLPKRCGESASGPVPKIGQGYLVLREGLVAASDDALAGYTYANETLTPAEIPGATAGALDLAGGHFHEERPDSVAVIRNATSAVEWVGAHPKTAALPFAPIAITAGDVDGDGLDEAIAVSAGGELAICAYESGKCRTLGANVASVVDVAAGDIDGDGILEVVLLDAQNKLTVASVAADASKLTGATSLVPTQPSPPSLGRLAVGDVDGDGKADILGMVESGYFSSGKLFTVTPKSDGYLTASETTLAGSPTDLAIAWLGNGRGHVVVLAGEQASIYGLENGAFTTPSRFAVASGAKHIAASDFTGKSAIAKSTGPGKVVEGQLTPVAAIFPPPYSRTYSATKPWGALSSTDWNRDAQTKSLAMSYSGFAGLNITTPIGSVGFQLTKGWSHNVTTGKNQTVTLQSDFLVNANPDADGQTSGSVMLSCTCYHRYEFDIDDPLGELSPEKYGKTMSIFLPIGPKTQAVSLRRYAALVKALPKELPPIEPTFKLGDLASYPKEPTSLAGKPLTPKEIVFKEAKSIRVSDTADVGFRMEFTAEKWNATATTISSGVNASAYPGIFAVGLSAESRKEQTEQTTIGAGTAFAGRIGPVRDDPSTPEDEYKEHGYSVTPIVYLQRYTNKNGAKAGFYVLTYTVGE